MAFPLVGGRDIALQRNDLSQRFDFTWDGTGNPAFDDTGTHLVLSLLLEYRGLWFADLSGQRGSVLYLIKQDTVSTKSEIEKAVKDALTPAVDSGQLISFTAIATRLFPGSYQLNLNWVTSSQVLGTLILPITD